MISELINQINNLLGGQTFWTDFNRLRSQMQQLEYQFPEEAFFTVKALNALAPLGAWGSGELDYGDKLNNFDSLDDYAKVQVYHWITSIANVEMGMDTLDSFLEKVSSLNLGKMDIPFMQSMINKIRYAVGVAGLIRDELYEKENIQYLLQNEKHLSHKD